MQMEARILKKLTLVNPAEWISSVDFMSGTNIFTGQKETVTGMKVEKTHLFLQEDCISSQDSFHELLVAYYTTSCCLCLILSYYG